MLRLYAKKEKIVLFQDLARIMHPLAQHARIWKPMILKSPKSVMICVVLMISVASNNPGI